LTVFLARLLKVVFTGVVFLTLYLPLCSQVCSSMFLSSVSLAPLLSSGSSSGITTVIKINLAVQMDHYPSTLAYYTRNADEFCKTADDIDMAGPRRDFLSFLPSCTGKPLKILDVGCGSGRDSLAFKNAGYEVFAMDPCQAMVDATTAKGVAAYKMHVMDINPSLRFHGIWACASLLHLSKRDLPLAVEHLSSLLVNGGVLSVWVKYGLGENYSTDGRFFSYYSPAELHEVFSASGLAPIRGGIENVSNSRNQSVTWAFCLGKKSISE